MVRLMLMKLYANDWNLNRLPSKSRIPFLLNARSPRPRDVASTHFLSHLVENRIKYRRADSRSGIHRRSGRCSGRRFGGLDGLGGSWGSPVSSLNSVLRTGIGQSIGVRQPSQTGFLCLPADFINELPGFRGTRGKRFLF